MELDFRDEDAFFSCGGGAAYCDERPCEVDGIGRSEPVVRRPWTASVAPFRRLTCPEDAIDSSSTTIGFLFEPGSVGSGGLAPVSSSKSSGEGGRKMNGGKSSFWTGGGSAN